MKTSNILMLSFVTLSVALMTVVAVKASSEAKKELEKQKMVKNNHDGMVLKQLPLAAAISIEGSEKLVVVVECKAEAESKVWIDEAIKNQVEISSKDGVLHIRSLADDSRGLIVVATATPESLVVGNSRCILKNPDAPKMAVTLSGDASLQVGEGIVSEVTFIANNSASASFNGVEVKKWNITMNGDSELKGVSPNSQLTMSVAESARVELAHK